jgi:hypothetical protein
MSKEPFCRSDEVGVYFRSITESSCYKIANK